MSQDKKKKQNQAQEFLENDFNNEGFDQNLINQLDNNIDSLKSSLQEVENEIRMFKEEFEEILKLKETLILKLNNHQEEEPKAKPVKKMMQERFEAEKNDLAEALQQKIVQAIDKLKSPNLELLKFKFQKLVSDVKEVDTRTKTLKQKFEIAKTTMPKANCETEIGIRKSMRLKTPNKRYISATDDDENKVNDGLKANKLEKLKH